MDIRGINSYNQFYSPGQIQRNKPVDVGQDVANASVGSAEKQHHINQAHEIPPVSTLNLDEKEYFAESFKTNPQVQTYLGTGHVQEFLPKGQVVDFRG